MHFSDLQYYNTTYYTYTRVVDNYYILLRIINMLTHVTVLTNIRNGLMVQIIKIDFTDVKFSKRQTIITYLLL